LIDGRLFAPNCTSGQRQRLPAAGACMTVRHGGKHADYTVDFQEFMIAPRHVPSYAEAIRMGMETFHTLKHVPPAKNGHGESRCRGSFDGC
jgi:enolase